MSRIVALSFALATCTASVALAQIPPSTSFAGTVDRVTLRRQPSSARLFEEPRAGREIRGEHHAGPFVVVADTTRTPAVRAAIALDANARAWLASPAVARRAVARRRITPGGIVGLGAAIGGGVGAGIGAVWESRSSDIQTGTGVLISAGIGAGIGALIGWLIAD
jgi:hypothetical protein